MFRVLKCFNADNVILPRALKPLMQDNVNCRRVVATEISKSSVAAAQYNMEVRKRVGFGMESGHD